MEDQIRRWRLTNSHVAMPTWVEAMEFAHALVGQRLAVYRPQVQRRADGRWNVWWVEAS